MIFNYNTLNVELQPATKSIFVSLARPESNNSINIEMLFEMEGLFGWLTSHLEVNTVIIRGEGGYLSSGFDDHELSIMGHDKLKKYLGRFQKLIQGMQYLPQTVICDLGKGAAGMAIELSLCADIRICHEEARLEFNSLQKGWVPCAGGITMLSRYIGPSLARQWTLCSATVNAEKLENAGLVMCKYLGKENKRLQEILENISRQAPVARIQTKRSFLENDLESHLNVQHNDSRFAFAGLHLREWTKTDYQDFVPAREMAHALKEVNKDSEPEQSGPRLV